MEKEEVKETAESGGSPLNYVLEDCNKIDRAEYIKKLIKKRGYGYVARIILLGPFVFIFVFAGEIIESVGLWMQHFGKRIDF